MHSTFIVGRLVADPEIKFSKAGEPIANFRVAINEGDHTEFYRVVAFKHQAKFVGDYLKKGDWISVTGRMNTRSWEDKDGNMRSTTELKADRVQGMGTRSKGGDEGLDDNDRPF